MTIMWVLGIGQEGERERETVALFVSSLTGPQLCLFFLSKLLCVCVFRPHSLWRSSSRCGRRNRSALRWPRSPPRWRRGRRCVAGRTPLCKDGKKENSRKKERKLSCKDFARGEDHWLEQLPRLNQQIVTARTFTGSANQQINRDCWLFSNSFYL